MTVFQQNWIVLRERYLWVCEKCHWSFWKLYISLTFLIVYCYFFQYSNVNYGSNWLLFTASSMSAIFLFWAYLMKVIPKRVVRTKVDIYVLFHYRNKITKVIRLCSVYFNMRKCEREWWFRTWRILNIDFKKDYFVTSTQPHSCTSLRKMLFLNKINLYQCTNFIHKNIYM